MTSDTPSGPPDDFAADFTGDLSGDLSGDWLSESLDDTMHGIQRTPLQTDALIGTEKSDGKVAGRGGSIPTTKDERESDTESWERTVIGDTDLDDDFDDDLDGDVAVAATPSKSPAAPASKDKAKTDAKKPASQTGPSSAPSGRKRPPKLTRRERRKLRRQDKRNAEHEAKLLMYRRPLWRGRVVPKTVLGISFTMLTTGLALATSGTLLYMNYRYRQDQSDALVRSFPQQVRQAQRAVQNEGRNARSQIQTELEPLRKLAATAETLTTVLKGAEPSVWAVRTFDVDGQGTAGTAFVVASDDEKTFMLTSLSAVQASTAKPGPQIKVRKGDKEEIATLWTWDESRDLALLVVNGIGGQPPLSWAAPNAVKLGDQIFSVSGFGTNNASIVEGRIADLSADGIQHTAPVGTHFRGGPIIDGQGRVVAIASRSFAPLGFASDGVFFAPPISGACDKVLRCLNNRVDGAGSQR